MSLSAKDKKRLAEAWKQGKSLSLKHSFRGDIQHATHGTDEERKTLLKKLSGIQKLSREEVEAEESDFVEVTYRALSAAMLADRAVDFSDAKMLKRATKMLDGHTVFKDHNQIVDNWVGRVSGTTWDEGSKDFPPGINANLRLDTVKDPMAVRGVLQGAIHSASVTVSFEWKPSHPDMMDSGVFWSRMGEEDEEGELIRIIVTKILRFWEISLVWQGADQYAKQLDEDGNAVMENGIQFSENEIEEEDDLDPDQETLEEFATMDKKFLAMLKKVFGAEVTEENFETLLETHTSAAVAELKTAKGALELEIEKLTGEKADILKASETLTAKVAEQKSQIEKLEPSAKMGESYVAAERADALRLCKLVKGNEVSAAILKTLESAELEVVQAFRDEFKKEADSRFPQKCQSCGGKHIERQSSATQVADETETERVAVNVEQAKRLQNLHG